MAKKDKEKISQSQLAFIGRPGSGKGTQVDLVQKRFDMILIPSPGLIYRDPGFRKTKWGKIVGPIIDKGGFAPDDITNQIMKQEIFKVTKTKKGFVSEGYPRTLGQAEFADKEIGIDWLINLEVPENKIIERLTKRRICQKCKKLFISGIDIPVRAKKCPKCNGRIVQRKDDKPEAIKTRLKVYYKTAAPTIEYYRRKGKLIEINGDQSIDDVFQEILKKIDRKIK